jgi:hypothetical protein
VVPDNNDVVLIHAAWANLDVTVVVLTRPSSCDLSGAAAVLRAIHNVVADGYGPRDPVPLDKNVPTEVAIRSFEVEGRGAGSAS